MTQNKVLIIAEAGVNHNGDLDLAKKLIIAAADAGADYVKFQTFKAKNLVQQNAKKADYQIENTANNDSQYKMLEKLEIPLEWYPILRSTAKEHKIGFLSTGFDEESIDFLDEFGCDFFKIPSGEITNKPYLQHIASKKKPIIISTGMSGIKEINDALNTLIESDIPKEKITVLHCNTQYPTPMEDVNLHAMNDIKTTFDVKIGYSDHTLGIEVPIAAVALGAEVIEKHFTLDRNLPGPDHRASLTPEELKAMVAGIRNIELAISGSGKKEISPSEKNNVQAARKSIHLKHDLKEGQLITKSDLIMLRPGDGISPMEFDQILGKEVNSDLSAFHKLNWNDLK